MFDNTKVALFGAFERHNLGDWLMAWCFEKLSDGKFSPWVTASLTPMHALGHENHTSFKDWHFQGGRSVLHVGGDILACTTDIALAFSDQKEKTLGVGRFPYLLPSEGAGYTLEERILFGGGGTGLDKLSNEDIAMLQETLEGMELFVRDQWTVEQLEKNGIKAALAPCVVSLYPDLVSPAKAAEQPFVLVQVSDALLEAFSDSLVPVLEGLSKQLEDRKIILVAAGLSKGHDSYWALEILHARLLKRGCDVEVCFLANPHAVANLVSCSSMVISSSLHLQILAMAFSVPRVSIATLKGERYADSWDLPGLVAHTGADLEKCVHHALSIDKKDLEEVAEANKNAAYSALSSFMPGLQKTEESKQEVVVAPEIGQSKYAGGMAQSLERLANDRVEFEGQRDHFEGLAAGFETELGVERERVVEFEGQRDHFEGLAAGFETELGVERERVVEFEGQRDHFEGLAAGFETELSIERERIAKILISRSWRLTKPFRWVSQVFKKRDS